MPGSNAPVGPGATCQGQATNQELGDGGIAQRAFAPLCGVGTAALSAGGRVRSTSVPISTPSSAPPKTPSTAGPPNARFSRHAEQPPRARHIDPDDARAAPGEPDRDVGGATTELDRVLYRRRRQNAYCAASGDGPVNGATWRRG